MQKEGLNKDLYTKVYTIPKSVIATKNRAKSFQYGYDKKYDTIVISKDGTIGDIYQINKLNIALPSSPKKIHKRDNIKSNQY